MRLSLHPKPPDRLLPTGIVQQTAFWGRFKTRLGWQARAFDIRLPHFPPGGDALPEADILVVARRIGEGASLAYAPYGPEFEPAEEDRGACLERLSEGLRPHLPPDCAFIRYDLSWESAYAREPDRYDEEGRWQGPPPSHLRELRMNFGTERRTLRKAATDLMPTDTVVVDLRPSPEDILARMRPSTRRNILLSGRAGVEVSRAGRDDLESWYGLYEETARRDGFQVHARAHFDAVLAEDGAEDGVAAGAGGRADAEVRLLLARLAGEPVAGLVLALSGNRATFLYGASAAAARDCRASYALQWEAILLAKSRGCLEYDLFGCSPRPDPAHPLFGLWQYKTGFGGELVHRQGCWDYPLDPAAYDAYRAREEIAAGRVAVTR